MTRDEAVKKLDEGRVVQYPGDFVDGLVALGLLNLDEPKDADTAFIDVVGKWRASTSAGSILALMDMLDISGLKVVEK